MGLLRCYGLPDLDGLQSLPASKDMMAKGDLAQLRSIILLPDHTSTESTVKKEVLINTLFMLVMVMVLRLSRTAMLSHNIGGV